MMYLINGGRVHKNIFKTFILTNLEDIKETERVIKEMEKSDVGMEIGGEYFEVK